jgi:hypothetical protein
VAMTKRHYEAIAAVINKQRENAQESHYKERARDHDMLAKFALGGLSWLETTTRELADVFAVITHRLTLHDS